MTSNIYEDPNLTTKVKFCRGVDRGEREERVVDIYEGITICTENQPSAGDGGPSRPPAARRSCCRADLLIQSLLLILLLAAAVILTKLYLQNVELKGRNDDLQRKYDRLRHSVYGSEGNSTGWTRFQCSCYFQSEEEKNWTESRADCRTRGADLLVINNRQEHDFVKGLKKNRTSWIGLESVAEGPNYEPKWEWRWVDGAADQYLPWARYVKTTALNGSKGFLNDRGSFNHSTNGLRWWICERTIKNL